MRKKLAIIFGLAAAFAALLVLRPWESDEEDVPRFFDRLPDADIIGKANLLELTESLEQTTYHYKIPFREFLTREFVLLQSKSFGIDVQNPVYFFANENEWELRDFGAMFHVKDSSLIEKGVRRLSSVVKLSDTLIYDQRVYQNRSSKISIAYGSDWLLFYCGDDFKRMYHDVLFAKRNEIPPNWRAFLNQTKMDGTALVAKWSSKDLDKYSINAVDLRLQNDSTSITLLSQVHQNDSIAIRMLDSGPTYAKQEYTRTLANLHLDASGLRDHPNDPLVQIMKQVAQKISFPVQDFLMAWEGSVAFRQGGLQTYREKYIESELDENFNITEVVKYKTIKLPGFSLYLAMNESYPDFLDRLKVKGILTKPDKRYRLLFSPPLALQEDESAISLHTATYYEKPDTSTANSVMFTYDKTPYTFHLDSLGTNTYYCRFHIPLARLVETNIPTDEF
ncbi:MAG: hypothetical protein DCO96_00685 [Fluviicola sp. XM-24bin1]|nr:MAG: hypothetical protein DCO96_00685 [Fluviicola sp. XM-24bin1]